MGDYTSYIAIIHAIPDRPPHKLGPSFKQVTAHEQVLSLFRDFGLNEIWDRADTGPTPADIDTETTVRLGAVYQGHELSVGLEDELGPKLERLEATYEIHGDAFGDCEAVVRYGTPHLGVFQSMSSQSEGLPILGTRHIEQLIAESKNHQELIDQLSIATGKAWRDFFERAQLPPTDEDMRLARLSLLRAQEVLADEHA